jgi:chromosome segregation ATPase
MRKNWQVFNFLAVLFIFISISISAVLAQEGSSGGADFGEVDTVINDFNRLRAELASSRQSYQRLKEEYLLQEKNYETRLTQLSAEKDTLKAQAQQVSAQISDYQNKLDRLQAEKASFEAQARDLKAKEQSWQVQSQQLTTTLLEKDKAILDFSGAKQQLFLQNKDLE